EVKNVEEQPAERRNHAERSLQNFRVIHKSSISLKDTSQISSVHADTPILSIKEPENSLSMGYEHFSITLETESESNAKNLLSIPSECEVTLEDKRECDELVCKNPSTIDVCDNHSDIFSNSNNADDISIDDNAFEDIEYVEASLSDPEIVSVEEENINLVENDILDNSTNDPLLEEVDLFLSDDSIPPGIENVADGPEGDVRFLEELLIDDSILSHELSDDNNSSFSRPPPEPPDVESFFDLKPGMIAEEISDKLNEDKCFDPGREINFSIKIKDDDYFPFMFVIRFFLPYLILLEISPLFLSAESEDTIFDPGLSPKIEDFLCRILSWFSRPSYPLIDFSLGKSLSVIYIAYS
nr:hypothetical protein [Tanacetum cinerariifolium]